MSGEPAINELEKRIAVVRQNIAGLVERAAAFSGAGDEARAADRIAEQEQELARLIALRGLTRGPKITTFNRGALTPRIRCLDRGDEQQSRHSAAAITP
jgi:hypothetical protein